MTDLVMPRLSDSMEQGTILSWLKASGDRVEVGDELLEIETDKSTVTYSAELAGVLQILEAEGVTVPVGQPIGRIGETIDETAASEERQAPTRLPTPVADPAAGGRDTKIGTANGRRPVATPLARRAAAIHGIALDGIAGTGPLGRITRDDVLRRAGVAPSHGPGPSTPPDTPRPTLPADSAVGVTHLEPSRLQQLIAQRMTAAKATIPHFQVQTEATMDRVIILRSELNSLVQENETVPSFNDIIIKAAALALRDHPLANGSFTAGRFELHEAVNVGMAVAAEDALVVPIIHAADTKSLGQIARDTRRLVALVRSGHISPAELSGGTFTVSNLGMFGMTAITPVINPPQAAILGVGAVRETLARENGEIVDRAVVTLTLSCDHRILYGADAANFLARIRQLLEAPLGMAL